MSHDVRLQGCWERPSLFESGAAKSYKIMVNLRLWATHPSLCLCLSHPPDNSEETVSADSRKPQSRRMKVPLKLCIRFDRHTVQNEKGTRASAFKLYRGLSQRCGFWHPFETDPKWDGTGQFSVSTACQSQ